MPQPKVSVILLHLNDVDGLLECLASLWCLLYPDFDVLLVHNGPRDPALEEKTAPFSAILAEVIHTGENFGFARGSNIGIKRALEKGADYILLLNDDTVVSPDFLSILVDAWESNPKAGMLGPKIYYFDEPEKIWFSGALLDPEVFNIRTINADQLEDGEISHSIESDYITGCALLISKEVIKTIGVLDERFFLYWEDVAWGLRAKKSGFKNLVIPPAHVWHKVSSSSGGMDSLIRVYHKTRSYLLLAKLHAPNSLVRLHVQFFKDIAWLLFKSKEVNRFKKAHVFIASIRDYHIGKTDKGPDWLWSKT